MLYGCQQLVDEFVQGMWMNLLVDKYGFVVLYLEQLLCVYVYGCWYWYEDIDCVGCGEVNVVVLLVDVLVDEYGFDVLCVYVVGLLVGVGLVLFFVLYYLDCFVVVVLYLGLVLGEVNFGIIVMDVMWCGLW